MGLKLTLGMAERRNTKCPIDEESWGGGQWFESWSDPKSPGLAGTQTGWHSIASQLGSLDLQPGLTCPCDGAWGLEEDQSWARGVGNQGAPFLIDYNNRIAAGFDLTLFINLHHTDVLSPAFWFTKAGT